jgi:diadenylate cyclase
MVMRVAREISELLDELGEHGRLLRLQLEELLLGVDEDRRLVVDDYLDPIRGVAADDLIDRLSRLSTGELLGLDKVVDALADGTASPSDLDEALAPRGLRLLGRIPHLAPELVVQIVENFGDLHQVVRAPASELATITGISEAQAQLVKDGLAHLAESSILDRYS